MGENDKIDRLLSLEVRGTDLAAINDAVDEIDRLLQEIKRLREMLGQCKEEWHSAIYADLEQCFIGQNNAATEEFNQRYPNVSKFGDFLNFERTEK